MSLVRQYLEQVYNIRTSAAGNAINYANGRGAGANLLAANGFTWHTDTNFQNGDILVWQQNAASVIPANGHIGIWYGGQVYDQSDARGAHVGQGGSGVRTANYSGGLFTGGYLGYWRKGGTPPVPTYPVGVVMAQTQRMSAATLKSQQLGWYGVGTNLSLVCHATGQAVKGYFSFNIKGGFDSLWYKTTDGGYVADVDIQTGTLNAVGPGC